MATAEKIITVFIILTMVISAAALIYASKAVFFPSANNNDITAAAAGNKMGQKMGRMSLTPFDVQLAREFMDKDNDGKCDSCGMDVELCIGSGQLQCNMDSSSTIGILGSQHIHADWKIYIDGKLFDLSDKSHMERMQTNQPVSSFMHVDSGAPAPEKTGDVLHMHATGVPLWIFFESIGVDFNKDCITLEDKQKICNDKNKKLKFFVNGKENSEFGNYVFSDLDKILVSYGNENEEQLKEQLASITGFSKIH